MSHDDVVSEIERAVLEERARALARPPRGGEVSAANTVVFRLSRERFALPAQNVFAVFRLSTLVRLPGAHPPVVGVTRWRGDVLTLIDVRSLVGASTTALDDLAIVLAIGIDQAEFGILADELEAPMTLASDEPLLPATRADAGAHAVIRGVTRDGHLVLDAAALIHRQIGTALPAPTSSSPRTL